MKETLQKDEQEMRKSKFNNVLLNMVEVGIYILYFLKFATTIQEICFDIFDIIKKTGRNRCEAATLLASVITLLLLFSKNAELLCNSICFAYPAVKSLEKCIGCSNVFSLFGCSCQVAVVLRCYMENFFHQFLDNQTTASEISTILQDGGKILSTD
ncbi:hypothetical protein T4A_14398 [Trichinella pseudospiralis]|uniref:Uncharacterized protein n=1 Tax=Trichinella pseudospiralis TaxID=6337 RepID=A0A0V1EWA8_TRIPS|nr:hypothetical protein T4A_14398 [Trichinella pseudospiralis]